MNSRSYGFPACVLASILCLSHGCNDSAANIPAGVTPGGVPSGELCSDSCFWAGDGECDDGGEGANFDLCEYGSDCSDCGRRAASTGNGGSSTGDGSPDGQSDSTGTVDTDLDWTLPALPGLAEEQAAIIPSITSLRSALAAKDVGSALEWFAPEVRSQYEQLFELAPEAMPGLSAALDAARLVMVSDGDKRDDDGTTRRLGDLEVTYEGVTYHVTVVKVNDTWMFRGL